MTIKGLDLCWIVVENLNDAISYYTKVIGLSLREHHEQFGWAELEGARGARLGLAQADEKMGMKAGVNAVFTLSVENLEAKCSELEAAGVRMIGDVMEVPGEVRMQLCADKDGNQFQLIEQLAEVA